MSTLAIARKELRRHRVSTLALFCGVLLLLLAAAALVPRTWTARAVIELDTDPTRIEALSGQLRALLQAAAGEHPLAITQEGSRIRVGYPAEEAQRALEELNALLARVVKGEIGRLREAYESEERQLAAQVAQASSQVDAIAARMTATQSGLPEGGETALGARIGQLQGERDALRLDLRASAELKSKLEARVRELDAEIATLRDVSADEQAAAASRIDAELKPQRNTAAARLATLHDEILVKERRQREIDNLLAGARGETSALKQESEALRDLQRRHDDALAEHRQLRQRLQEARDRIALKTTASALPFRVANQPLLPDSPDGIAAWIWLLGAIAGGLLVAALRLLGSVLVDDRVRLAEEIVVDAELPVLAVVAEYRPTQTGGPVRWSIVVAALLVALTVAAALAFLVAFG